jgi:hypothetical protein
MMDRATALTMVDSLRQGVPPRTGVKYYSVGNQKLLDGISRFLLSYISVRGYIRFVSGSWGSGKTHFFRMLQEAAFEHNCMVSVVELSVNEAALNRFETVFFQIMRHITSPRMYEAAMSPSIAPFESLLEEALRTLAGVGQDAPVTVEDVTRASLTLMQNPGIDLDFKKIIRQYWETFVFEGVEELALIEKRSEIAQWFTGEGRLQEFRKRYNVNKMVTKENAKLILQSLAAFVRMMGYAGLLILFDEAEQAYSLMRKVSLKEVHNTLLSLINNIESVPGLFMVYATTPDFYNDPKHGIVIYGALSGRIGQPEPRPPRALDMVWNLDAEPPTLEDYQEAARKVAAIHRAAYDGEGPMAAEVEDDALRRLVAELYANHSTLSPVRFWRVMMPAVVRWRDGLLIGEELPALKLYDDVMARLREN